MPLYEYQCEACAHRFEQIQRFSDPPLESCPQCSGAVRKLVSSPAIQFKGSGWYVTDYARQGRKDPTDAGESKAGAPADGAKSDKKSDKPSSGSSGGSLSSSDSAAAPAKPASAGAGSSS